MRDRTQIGYVIIYYRKSKRIRWIRNLLGVMLPFSSLNVKRFLEIHLQTAEELESVSNDRSKYTQEYNVIQNIFDSSNVAMKKLDSIFHDVQTNEMEHTERNY